MDIQELSKDVEQRRAHTKKYAKTPLHKAPNLGLGRPLTKHEMKCLRLIGACKHQNRTYYNNWIRCIVLCGNIPAFVKEYEQAMQNEFYVVIQTEYIPHGTNLIAQAKAVCVPFPPTKTFGHSSR